MAQLHFKQVVCAMYVPKNDLFFAICLGLRPQFFLNIKLPFRDRWRKSHSCQHICQKEFGKVFQGGDHSKKVFMFKGIALYADPSLRQVQLIDSDATVDILGQFSDTKYQVRVFFARAHWAWRIF